MSHHQYGDEGRFKVAAATAAVVPFHCVVCFDEFSLKERPPVVLPCGHTYICAPCSKRLKRCMECREPLFITLKHNTQQPSSYNAPRAPILPAPAMYGRYSPTPSTPPQATASSSSYVHNGTSQQIVQQIPLAIPKNVVLICMMEAAERQMRDSNNIANGGNSEAVVELIDDTNGSMNASDEDEEYDLNRIISGMATFSGPCGTYAVKERNGLSILTQYPHTNSSEYNDDNDDDNEEESRNDDITRTTALHVTASYDSIEVSNPCTLKHGQTVQVVRFENGIATLAREAGYIRATSSQLVKVGGPLEKACRLEGLLDTVINRGKDLQRELEENNRIEEALRREIQTEMQIEPEHPVITDIPDLTEDIIEPITPKASGMNKELQQPAFGTPNESPLSETSSVKKSTDLSQYQIRPLPHSPSDNNDVTPEFRAPGLPAYRTRQASSFDDESMLADYGCGAAILGNSAFRLFTTSSSAVEHHPRQLHENPYSVVAQTNSYGNTSSRFRSMSSDAQHHHHGDLGSTSSFDAIDFRTGMSGHRGLNKSSTANSSKVNGTNNYYHYGHHSPTPHSGSRFMMSEHRGIARVRGPLQKIYASNTSTP